MIDRQAPHAREAGFTLIEMAIVIVIAGMILTFVISAVGTGQNNRRDSLTRERMALIAKTLANYAAQYNRLPCSASPNPAAAADLPLGIERGTGTVTTVVECQTVANSEGILPFRTLGLPEEMARDAWGRYFTYRVSPAFTRNPALATQAHANCRINNTWVETTGPSNYNSRKASFCCPDTSGLFTVATDVLVRDASTGSRVISPLYAPASPAATRDTANYGAFATGVAAAPTNGTNLTFAFVLVSHGANGHGAYLVNGTANRLDLGAGNFGTDEGENADGNVTFVDRTRTDATGTTYFDDIVIWRTQNTLYQEIGGSCAIPR